MKVSDTMHRLREVLRLKKMTSVALSEKCGIATSTLSNYMTGKYAPKQDNIYSICKALNISEAWLMGYDVPMERDESNYVLTEEDKKGITEMTPKKYFNDGSKRYKLNLWDSIIDVYLELDMKTNELLIDINKNLSSLEDYEDLAYINSLIKLELARKKKK